jgi:hypothetical protein
MISSCIYSTHHVVSVTHNESLNLTCSVATLYQFLCNFCKYFNELIYYYLTISACLLLVCIHCDLTKRLIKHNKITQEHYCKS